MHAIETLEPRKLLTAALGADGILRITGTTGNDSVSVSLESSVTNIVTEPSGSAPVQHVRHVSIVVNEGGTNELFDVSKVRRISWAGRAGNDLITLGRVNVPAFLNGGSGNDSISSSHGDKGDTLIGGDGNDYLFAGAGNDSLDGGNGGDTMFGNAGDDFIQVRSDLNSDDIVSGGLGTDTVSLATYQVGAIISVGLLHPLVSGSVTDGVQGDVERILGSAQGDHITNLSGRSLYVDGGAGNDQILMGKGNDTIIGGSGRDLINGGPGNDTIFAKDNQIDTLMGGTGHDDVTFDLNDVV